MIKLFIRDLLFYFWKYVIIHLYVNGSFDRILIVL